MTITRVLDDAATLNLYGANLRDDDSSSSTSNNEMTQHEFDDMTNAEFGSWRETEGIERSSIGGGRRSGRRSSRRDNIDLSERGTRNNDGTRRSIHHPRSFPPMATSRVGASTTMLDGGINPRISACDDWRREDDDDNGDDDGGHEATAKETKDSAIRGGRGVISSDNIMVSVFIRGWCVVWVIFAMSVIVIEVLSPDRSAIIQSAQFGSRDIVRVRNEQQFLELSERVVSSCSYSNLDAEIGREECRELCHDHMCCFVDDDNDDDHYEDNENGSNDNELTTDGRRIMHRAYSSGSGSCSNDPRKMCAAYAGCQSLVISEEDAIIYDADGVEVFGDVENDEYIPDDADDGRWSHPSAASGEISYDEEDDLAGLSGGANSTTLASDLRLVRRVISSVCSTANLHTKRGLLECASLCNPSVCCFDKNEILSLNPKLDIVLKMEGIDDTILNTSLMGTCTGKEMTARGHHFCQAHIGCKYMLFLGSPSAAHLSHAFANDADVMYEEDDQLASSSIPDSAKQHTLITVSALFGMILGVTIYLLIYNREYAPLKDMKMPSNRMSFDNADDARSSQSHNDVEFV